MADFPASIPKPTNLKYTFLSNCKEVRTLRAFRLYPNKRSSAVMIRLNYFLTMTQKNDLLAAYKAARNGADYMNIELPINDDYATVQARFASPLKYKYEGVSTIAEANLETYTMPNISQAEVNSALGR